MATRPDYPLVTAAEFLRMDFGDRKAELDEGVIRMMAGGTARHNKVAGNIFLALGIRLRGSGSKPYLSALAVQTDDRSVRHPDVSVFSHGGRSANDDAKAFDDPVVLVEVHSAGTARTDLRAKLGEYQALASVDTIVFVDIATERLRIVQRAGPHAWHDQSHDDAVDLALPALDLVVPHAELFTRD